MGHVDRQPEQPHADVDGDEQFHRPSGEHGERNVFGRHQGSDQERRQQQGVDGVIRVAVDQPVGRQPDRRVAVGELREHLIEHVIGGAGEQAVIGVADQQHDRNGEENHGADEKIESLAVPRHFLAGKRVQDQILQIPAFFEKAAYHLLIHPACPVIMGGSPP